MNNMAHGVEKNQYHFALSDLFQMYSILLKIPENTLISGLIGGSAFDDLNEILLELKLGGLAEQCGITATQKYCAKQTPENLLHELRVDYTNQFVRTTKEPRVLINESQFLKRDDPAAQPLLFVNDIALELTALYKTVGLIRSKEFNYSEDHFAFQFEFLSRIHQILSVAKEEYAAYSEELNTYYQNHFEKWAIPFFSECEKETEVEVYKSFWLMGRRVSEEVLSRRN